MKSPRAKCIICNSNLKQVLPIISKEEQQFINPNHYFCPKEKNTHYVCVIKSLTKTPSLGGAVFYNKYVILSSGLYWTVAPSGSYMGSRYLVYNKPKSNEDISFDSLDIDNDNLNLWLQDFYMSEDNNIILKISEEIDFKNFSDIDIDNLMILS